MHRGAITAHRGGITAHALTTIGLDLAFRRLAAARRIHDAPSARERAGLSVLAVEVTCQRGRVALSRRCVAGRRRAPSLSEPRRASLGSWTAFIECWTAYIECRTAATEARPALIESSISHVRRPLSHLSGRACQVTRVVDDVRLSPRHRRGGSRDVRGAPGHERRQMRRVSNPRRH